MFQTSKGKSRRVLAAPLVVVLALALAACGSAGVQSDHPTGGSGGFTNDVVAQQVAINADPTGGLKWEKAVYEAQAGDVSFLVKNASGVMHQFAVEGNGVNVQSPHFAGGTTNTFTLKGLRPGEYQLVCNETGHKEAGMVAKLVVK